MRILMLTDAMGIGGAETHVLTLARELCKEGHAVTVGSAGGVWEASLQEVGVQSVRFPFDKRTPTAVVKAFVSLGRYVKETIFDVIHAHTRFTACLAHAVARQVPLVVTAHLPFPTSFWQKRLMYWGNATLAVSRDIARYVCQTYRVPASQIRLTVNGIDTDVFCPGPPVGKRILHISRLDEGRAKTALLLCEIAPRLWQADPQITVYIAGGGNKETEVKEAVRHANEAIGREVVFYVGAVSQVPTLLQSGYMFVGVSRAALEAMCVGLPVILAGDEGYGGIADETAFQNGIDTNFCERNSEETTASRLQRDILYLLSHPTEARAIGMARRETILSQYPAKVVAKDAMNAYREALRPKSVLLIGYYGFGNVGDETTRLCLEQNLRQKGVQTIRYIGNKTNRARGEIGRFSLSVFRAIRQSDKILLGGGNLLQSQTSRRSLYYYAALLRYAFLKNKRVGAVDIGIGPFRADKDRRLSGCLLSRMEDIICRTRADQDEILSLLVRARSTGPTVSVLPDICMTLPLRQRKESDGYTCVWIPRKKRGNNLVTEGMKVLLQRGWTLHICCLFPAKDAGFCQYASRILGVPWFPATQAYEIMTLCEGASVCISERLHGGIFSLLSSCPVWLTDTEKHRRWAADIEMSAASVGVPSPVRLFRSPAEWVSALPCPFDGVTGREKKKSEGWSPSDFGQILSAQKAEEDENGIDFL